MQKADLGRGGHRRFTNFVPGIRVRADRMAWPCHDAPKSASYGGNQQYRDLRGASWLRVGRLLALEDAIFAKIEGGMSPPQRDRLQRQMVRAEVHHGLDLGVMAAVAAISAAGGIPVSSCNGGCFAETHFEEFPVVSFHWPTDRLKLIRECAKEAGVAMWVHRHGELVISADYIRRFLLFAEALLRRKASF